jgi:hypothetical protein
VEPEDVLEPLLVDGSAVDVASDGERAVTREPDLDEDGKEQDPRQVLVDRAHGHPSIG